MQLLWLKPNGQRIGAYASKLLPAAVQWCASTCDVDDFYVKIVYRNVKFSELRYSVKASLLQYTLSSIHNCKVEME